MKIRIIISYFFLFFIMGCREDLVHLASELEANKVLFALRDSGLEATKSSVGKEWVVRISSSELTNALRVLEEKKVFQDSVLGEPQNAGAMFQSREEKKSGRDRELARTLSGSIRLIPLVRDARVHIYNTLFDPLALNMTEERSASVLVVHEDGGVNEDVIKELISKGAGLVKEKVSVLFVSVKGGEGDLESSSSLPKVQIEDTSSETHNPIVLNFKEQILGHLSNADNVVTWGIALVFILLLLSFYFKRKFKSRKLSRADILDKLNNEVGTSEFA